MVDFSLSEICRITGGRYIGAEGLREARVSGVNMDTRTLRPGELFVPIAGERFDGHDFMAAAAEKGALASLSGRDGEYPLPVIRVADTLEAYRALAGAYRDRFDIPIAGVTGSVGKTTTKELIAGVLAQKYNTLKNQGNFNNQTGVPLTLFRLNEEHEAAVVELGTNHFGEIASIASIVRPAIGVITNIGESHMEFFGSREGILREKASLLDYLQPGGRAVVNGDDDMLSALRGRENLVTYGLNEGNHIRASRIAERGFEGSSFVASYPGGSVELSIPAPGRHMVLNALCALAVGLELGMEVELIARGIEGYTPLSGRMDIVRARAVTVLNDAYNASPTSMRASIGIAAGAEGRTVLILGDMLELGEKGAGFHRQLGEYAAASGAGLILTVGALAEDLHRAAGENGAYALHFHSRRELTDSLSGLLKEGDTVLVKASSAMKLAEVAEYIAKNF